MKKKVLMTAFNSVDPWHQKVFQKKIFFNFFYDAGFFVTVQQGYRFR